jgi:hypothetical protein
MFKFLVLLSAALTSIRDCGNGQGRAALLAFDSQPTSPKPGDTVTLWVAYDLPAPEITGGTATYSFTYNGIPFPPTVNPLCDDTACPKLTGFNNESSYSEFPSGLSGKITSSVKWVDQNDELVWCVETTWKV